MSSGSTTGAISTVIASSTNVKCHQPTSRCLISQAPSATTLRRLVVRAQEIDVITGEVLAVGEHGQQPDLPEMKMEMLPI
jgi:hypothetical protein